MDKKTKSLIPKRKVTKKKKNVIPFISERKTRDHDEKIIESGTLGDLDYKVFSRGVIHISDKNEKALFKKDCGLFEDAIDKLDLNSLKEGDTKKITGSGDNDTLVFMCTEGDIKISLEKPEYSTIKKLKKILKLGCKKKINKQA